MSEDKGRKIPEDSKLFQLLDLYKHRCTGKERIGAAIIEEVRQNPLSAAMKYHFGCRSGWMIDHYPLHQAIFLRSSIGVVEAIYNSYPQAIQENCQGHTSLTLSIHHEAPVEVVLFLISKWPEAARYTTFNSGYTPLHEASDRHAPHEVFSSLLDIWPDAAKRKDRYGRTPLHVALTGARSPSIQTISLLLDRHPDAVKEKENLGKVPLHYAARQYYPTLDVILLLLQKWPGAILEEDYKGKTPLACCNKEREEVYQFLSSVSQIYSSKNLEDDKRKEIIEFFISIGWRYGILMLLDQQPVLLKYLDIDFKLFPDLFSTIGQHCKMKTMWKVVGNELDMIEGV